MHQHINMEFQKIVNFLSTNSDENLSRFVLKNGLKFMINQEEITMLIEKVEPKHKCYDLIYVVILMHILL